VRSQWGLEANGTSSLAGRFSGKAPTAADLARRLVGGSRGATSTASPASEKRAGKYLRLFLASSLRHAGYRSKLFDSLRTVALHFPLSLRLRLKVFKGEAKEGKSDAKTPVAASLLQHGERSRDIDDILNQAMQKAALMHKPRTPVAGPSSPGESVGPCGRVERHAAFQDRVPSASALTPQSNKG